MLKNILNLEGAQQLNKAEQKEINGGRNNCARVICPVGFCKNDSLPSCCWDCTLG